MAFVRVYMAMSVDEHGMHLRCDVECEVWSVECEK